MGRTGRVQFIVGKSYLSYWSYLSLESNAFIRQIRPIGLIGQTGLLPESPHTEVFAPGIYIRHSGGVYQGSYFFTVVV